MPNLRPHNTLAGFLQETLKKQVQREANEEWLKNLPQPRLLKVERVKIKPLSTGVYNLVRQILP